MQFQFSRSQREIQKAAQEFAKGEFDKNVALEMDRSQSYPQVILHKAAALGFIGIHWPEPYGGGGLGMLENVLVAEAFCQRDASIGIALMFTGLGAECILRFGSEALKGDLLPKVARGDIRVATAFTEPGWGYDLNGIGTTAYAEGEQWIIDGHKCEVLNGGVCGFYCVLCVTDPQKPPSMGVSMLMVEGDRPGIVVADGRDKLGLRLAATTDVLFQAVRVPRSNLIGRSGRGLQQANAFLSECRLLIAALALGTARGAYKRALDYVRQRQQFGFKIGQFQVTRHKLAEMALMIEQAAWITYRAAWHFDQKQGDAAGVAMAKSAACRTALSVSSEAIQLLGGYGYMAEYEVERFCRDAKVLELMAGNSAVLNDIVAAKLIGKLH